MNTEEKARRYDEAVKRAKAAIDMAADKDLVGGVVRTIFPELAESEDERIRKAIIELLKEVGRDDTGISENAKCMIAYLEKQKVNTEGDFGRGYDCGYEACLHSHGAEWFEKQKEHLPIPDKFSGLKSLMLQYLQSAANRKDDTEIESDTDLWGRKILDYVWKYSDEQKEQKSVESHKRNKPKESWLSSAKYEIEHADELLIQRQEELREIREVKKKEQKPKDITLSREDCFHQLFENGTITMADYLYLTTNRREQKPAEKQDYSGLNDLERAIHRGFLSAGVENVPVTVIKETAKECLAQMKPAEWHPTHKQMVALSWAANGMLDNNSISAGDIKADLRSLYNDLQSKSIKPAEWSEEDEKMLIWLCRIIHSRVVNKELSLAEESELGKWIDKWINNEPQHEKKWSEFDEDCLRRAIWYVENPAPTVVKDTNLVLWLQSIPERFNLQPKEEWSEEDEKMYKMLSSMIHGTFVVETQETQDKLLSWLKSHSSRPKSSDNWKPSEEQKEALEYVIRDYREDCCNATANYLQEILDHLKNM